jgi:hypothetical protein
VQQPFLLNLDGLLFSTKSRERSNGHLIGVEQCMFSVRQNKSCYSYLEAREASFKIEGDKLFLGEGQQIITQICKRLSSTEK